MTTPDESAFSDVSELVREVMSKRARILEDFARAYIAETGLAPSDVQMVETRSDYGGRITWHFERKPAERGK